MAAFARLEEDAIGAGDEDWEAEDVGFEGSAFEWLFGCKSELDGLCLSCGLPVPDSDWEILSARYPRRLEEPKTSVERALLDSWSVAEGLRNLEDEAEGRGVASLEVRLCDSVMPIAGDSDRCLLSLCECSWDRRECVHIVEIWSVGVMDGRLSSVGVAPHDDGAAASATAWTLHPVFGHVDPGPDSRHSCSRLVLSDG